MKWFLRKITGIAIINFIFLLFAAMLILSQKPQVAQKITPLASAPADAQAIAASTPAPVRNFFAELGSHNVKSSCWIVYKSHVYDITPFFGTHPGGDQIMLPYCGNDATIGFDATPHSSNAVSLLSQYLVQ